MSKTLIDKIIEQITDDICNYHNTEALEEFLILLHNEKTHSIFINFLPEEEQKDYTDYAENE
jgi:hypothetical protein